MAGRGPYSSNRIFTYLSRLPASLVIDAINGAAVPTQFVRSPRTDPDDAIADLCRREQTTEAHIGVAKIAGGRQVCHVASVSSVIRGWCVDHGFDAVVWTDLESNFEDETDRPFSVEAAISYLTSLPKATAARARKYISNAPVGTDTPLRRTLQEIGWLSR